VSRSPSQDGQTDKWEPQTGSHLNCQTYGPNELKTNPESIGIG
jgi:hypothetical protein